MTALPFGNAVRAGNIVNIRKMTDKDRQAR